MKQYIDEKEGQIDFFEKYNITPENNDNEEIQRDSTDGIYHGCILEFKLNINDPNKVLFQVIKYLSKLRIKGKNVPATIFLVDLNKNIVYEYKSKNYFKEIHKVYSGAASKTNEGFEAKAPLYKYALNNPSDDIKFRQELQKTEFLKIDIDENCIVGWAERYYSEVKDATKDDFLKADGELRKPVHFKDLINPYTGETNEKFKYIMDKLNDKLKKKKLGAFYTPIPYCEKAAELVREAIKRVPEGNDYIILDRCAGTGNLESVLTDEELSHCILSTYEYYEWLVLRERLEDKVKMILPVDKENITFDNGLIKENDAMSKYFIKNKYIKQFLNDKKCTVIIYENPPYADETSNGNGKAVHKSTSFILNEMKKDIKGKTTNEIANRFIWSSYKFYQRDDSDSIVLFSPIKYWKAGYSLMNKTFEKGFIFNRKHFHASASAVCCILWKNINKIEEKIKLDIFDIDNDDSLTYLDNFTLNRCKNVFSDKYYEQLTNENKKNFKTGITCSFDGHEFNDQNRIRVNPYFDPSLIGYLIAQQFDFGNPSLKCVLTRCSSYNGNGFYLTKNIYLKKLPLFCACRIDLSDFYKNGNIYTTSDGGNGFEKDQTFLKSCLIYTALSNYNKCLSFKGSDGRDYYNEICFDSLSTHKSQALIDLESFTLSTKDKVLIDLFNKIMKEASQTKNYNKNYSYGLYQIIQELNTSRKDENGKIVYDYPELNGDINTLKIKLKEYYKEFIEPKCFKYELLK